MSSIPQVTTCRVCDRPGVECEANDALKDVSEVMCEYGQLCTFEIRQEPDVERDRYRSIKTRKVARTLALRCHPVEYSPSQDTLERAGLHHGIRVMVWTAMYDWNQNSIEFNEIDEKRTTVDVDGDRYEVADLNRVGHYRGHYLYIVFGLNKM